MQSYEARLERTSIPKNFFEVFDLFIWICANTVRLSNFQFFPLKFFLFSKVILYDYPPPFCVQVYIVQCFLWIFIILLNLLLKLHILLIYFLSCYYENQCMEHSSELVKVDIASFPI